MKIIDIATRRRVTIAMFTVAVLLFGSVSLSRLKINLLPDLTYPTLTVRTEYAGAAPVEIENLITKPIEEALGVVKNVNELRSVSRSGQSDVVLEFAWGTDMDYASLDVREKLDGLQLPLEVERPVILRFDPSLDPIMRFALRMKRDTGDGSPSDAARSARPVVLQDEETIDEAALKYLRRFADEEIKKDLEASAGVAAVKVSGGLEDEVQVFVDQNKLAQLDLSLQRVVQVLGAENVNLSGGRLEEGTQQYLVRTINQFSTVDEIGDVILEARAGRPVYLRDVAEVRLGYKERESINRIGGVEAVEVAIYKEGNANTVAVARDVESRLHRLRGQLPDDMELVKVYDQSTFISNAVDEVINAGVIGGLLAVLILYLFLRDFATTVIVSLSIPVSVVATFNLMYGADISLNIMSLGGLALGIGLLVDNSIVVLENIARHRELGAARLDAARRGASEVTMAVIASTLTTVAVFAPLVFVKGIAGQLFRDQALTVTFSLLASLLVAITLIPMLASFGRRNAGEELASPDLKEPRTRVGRGLRWMRLFVFSSIPSRVARLIVILSRWVGSTFRIVLLPLTASFNWVYDRAAAAYPSLLEWSLRRRGLVLVAAFALFAASLLLVPRLGVEFIPPLTQGEFLVELRLPPGTPLEQTDAVMARVQRSALGVDAIESTFASVGTGNRMDANPDEGGENWGELHVAMISATDVEAEQDAFRSLRTELEGIPAVQYKFGRPTLFTFKTPVEIEIAGYNLDDLRLVSQAISQRLSGLDRFADVKSTTEQGHPEVRILFDRERAAALGLAVSDIADRVVNQVRGEVATRYSWRDRKIDILVRSREEDRASIEDVRQLIVNPERERPVTLESVADVVVDIGPSEVRRVSQQRVAMITANLRFGDLGAATQAIQGVLDDVSLPEGVSVTIAGQSQEMASSFRSLLFALALAVFLVYLVMASQFESLIHPFVIFFSIPLAAIGAIVALWITGSTLSVVVFIGLILLAGIVVNNAIVLVDLINQLRSQGNAKMSAIREAARLRLRPILMTTLTTTLGLLPLALGFGEGAEIRAPMGITVIGGLIVSTLLTLIVIPVMYSILDRTPERTESGIAA